MSDISAGVEASTRGVVSVPEGPSELVMSIKGIQEEVEDNQRISLILREEVEKFRK